MKILDWVNFAATLTLRKFNKAALNLLSRRSCGDEGRRGRPMRWLAFFIWLMLLSPQTSALAQAPTDVTAVEAALAAEPAVRVIVSRGIPSWLPLHLVQWP